MLLSLTKQGENNLSEKFFCEPNVAELMEQNNLRINYTSKSWFELLVQIHKINNQNSPNDADALTKLAAKKLKREKQVPNLSVLEKAAFNFIELALSHSPTGVKHAKDKELSTDNQIFAIMGLNKEKKYGNVIIVFERSIMYHSDFNMTPVSMGKLFKNDSFRNSYCPWLTKSEGDELNFVANTKIHPCIAGWEDLVLNLIALKTYSHLNLKPGTAIELDQVVEFEKKCDSHGLFEAHLPSIIPLNEIKCVLIEEEAFKNDLTDSERKMMSDILGEDRIIFCEKVDDDVASLKPLIDYLYKYKSPIHYGLFFSISNKFGELINYPLSIEKQKRLTLEFLAKGVDICILFTDLKEKDNAQGFKFIINLKNCMKEKDNLGKTLFFNKVNSSSNIIQACENGHFKNPEAFQKYQIVIQKVSKLFFGFKEWHVDLKIEEPGGKQVSLIKKAISKEKIALKYISFSCWSGLVCFQDISLKF